MDEERVFSLSYEQLTRFAEKRALLQIVGGDKLIIPFC